MARTFLREAAAGNLESWISNLEDASRLDFLNRLALRQGFGLRQGYGGQDDGQDERELKTENRKPLALALTLIKIPL